MVVGNALHILTALLRTVKVLGSYACRPIVIGEGVFNLVLVYLGIFNIWCAVL